MTSARRNPRRRPESSVSDGDEALAVCVEEYADTVECTFFPYDADDEALLTTWMTATDDAFVDLENWQ